jgi:hypothetical protein
MRATYAVYLGAFHAAIAELREFPPAPRDARLDRAVELLIARGKSSAMPFVSDLATRTEATRWINTRKHVKETSGERLQESSTHVTNATALLELLPLPDDATAAVKRANDYLDLLGTDRSPEVLAEYADVCDQLQAAARSIADW